MASQPQQYPGTPPQRLPTGAPQEPASGPVTPLGRASVEMQGLSLAEQPRPETGFGENFSATVEEMEIAGNIGSQRRNLGEGYRPLIAALSASDELWEGTIGGERGYAFSGRFAFNNPYGMAGQGFNGIPTAEVMRDMIFARIRERRRREPGFLPGVPDTADAFEAQIHQRNQARLTRIRDVQSRATGWGTVGGFLGGMAGSLEDPTNQATLLVGGASTTILRAIGRAAVENMIVEAASQPMVTQNYAVLGEDLTLRDNIRSVLFSGAAGGVFRGGAHVVGRAGGAAYDQIARGVFEHMPESVQRRWADAATVDDRLLVDILRATVPEEAWDPDTRAAVHVMEREADIREASPFESGPVGDEAHGSHLSDALQRIINETPPPSARADFAPAVGGGAFVDSFSRYMSGSSGPGTPRPYRGGTHASNARDFRTPMNTPLLAERDWELAPSPRRQDGGRSSGEDRHGKWFSVRYSDGSVHLFRHVGTLPTRTSGRAGEEMARSGRSGIGSSGPHTHRESWVSRNGHLAGIDPQAYIESSRGGGGATTAGRATPGPHFGDRSLPRGVRNNNPGNLIDGRMARGMPGYRGADDGQNPMAQFDTMADGIAAQEELLRRRLSSGRTITTLIRGTGRNDGFAPSERTGGDNPEASVQHYVDYLAQRLGMDPNARLSVADVPRLGEAIRDMEARGWREHMGGGEARAVAPVDDGSAARAATDDAEALALTRNMERDGPIIGEPSALGGVPVLRRDMFDSDEAWGDAQGRLARQYAGEPEPSRAVALRSPDEPTVAELWRLSQDELEALRASKQMSDRDKLIAALGPDGAKRFEALDRMRNSSDPERSDEGSRLFEEEFGDLTPDQERLVYGIGETDAQAADLDALIRAHSDVAPGDDAEWSAYMAAVSARRVSAADMVAVPGGGGTVEAQAAFVRMQRAYANLKTQGVEAAEIPGRMAAALVSRGGWDAADAGEVIGGFVDALFGLSGRAEDAGSRGVGDRARLLSGSSPVALLDPIVLKRFDEPGGEGATIQADSLAHDLRAAIAADPMLGERPYRVSEDSEETRPLTEILDALDNDVAAAAALKACLK